MKRPPDTSVDEDIFNGLVTSVVQRTLSMNIDGATLLQTLTPQDQQQLIRSTIHQLQPSPHRPEHPYHASLSPCNRPQPQCRRLHPVYLTK